MRTLKTLMGALALSGLMAATAVDAAATRSIQAKPKIAANQRPVCAPGTVLRQTAVHQGYATMRCIQPNEPGTGGSDDDGDGGGTGGTVLLVGALAAAGLGLAIAVGGGGDDSPGG